MESAKLNGVELEYEVKGSGDPVLLISTGPIADSFLPFLYEPALVEYYQLIRYRQQGQAGSTHGTAPVSFATHAADAAALLRHLGVRRAHVAGHSTGGTSPSSWPSTILTWFIRWLFWSHCSWACRAPQPYLRRQDPPWRLTARATVSRPWRIS